MCVQASRLRPSKTGTHQELRPRPQTERPGPAALGAVSTGALTQTASPSLLQVLKAFPKTFQKLVGDRAVWAAEDLSLLHAVTPTSLDVGEIKLNFDRYDNLGPLSDITAQSITLGAMRLLRRRDSGKLFAGKFIPRPEVCLCSGALGLPHAIESSGA